jgi:hypothetical protein
LARIRTIKPEFWTDEKIGECSTSARLLLIGALNFADDYGGLSRSAKQLKAQIFPYDSIDCEPLIQELLAVGVIVEYEAGGTKYLNIKNFTLHQKIDRPGKPRVPLVEPSTSIRRTLDEDSPLEGKGREGKVRERNIRGASCKRGHARKTCPPEFSPDTAYALALIPDLDAEAEVRKFRDHEFKRPISDWPRAWRNWVGNAKEWGSYGKAKSEFERRFS